MYSTVTHTSNSIRIMVEGCEMQSALLKLKHGVSFEDIENVFNSQVVEICSERDYFNDCCILMVKVAYRPDEVIIHDVISGCTNVFHAMYSGYKDPIPVTLIGWDFRNEPFLDYCIYKFAITGVRKGPRYF